ncbi:maleylpyruvate isomerase family mycothiol-dependent enzyme [Arthrobacter sp. ERGS1:01]|uniref:maleylpyruvate isomerase family mycothiol-dependent enzyme n=1 Tax=Arthrobacter sp. ERGS1:01 TaxID=1704044 RepID=UPI0009EC3060|nr:maleylpyruvate isomerase family mycothiol-dependent enzyme [Arthrobacter sp. ERGS1:01]
MKSATSPVPALPMTGRQVAAGGYTAVMTAMADSLDGLSPADWDAGTDCTGWTVRHLAAHLLGAQEDAKSVPVVLGRRRRGKRRYPAMTVLDAANQVQVEDHAALSTAELCRRYRANIPAVAQAVRRFPAALAWVPVDKTMAPGASPLRLGYLFNVIYLRDAWMHGIDLARATGLPRPVSAAETLVVGQVMRDAGIQWGAEPGVEVELTGVISGLWQLGATPVRARLRADGVELCRSLSGRTPDTQPVAVSGDLDMARKLADLRVLF